MWMPQGLLRKAVRHVAANYRDFFKLSQSPKHSRLCQSRGQALLLAAEAFV